MSSPLLPLGLGLLVGGSVTWFALSPSRLPAPDAPLPTPSPVALSSWSWRETSSPPVLSRDPAAAAVSAWLALRAPDGRPASYAARAASLRALLLRLPADAFPRLAAELSRSGSDEDLRLRGIAFSAWAAQDAPAAAVWALSQGEKTRGLAQEALSAWSAKDPAAAARWACAIADDKIAAGLAGQALSTLAEKDPARALELARSRDDTFRESVLGAILRTLGKTDPAGTLRTFAPELWKNGRGFYQLRDVISSWMKKDASAAISWLLAQPRDGNSRDVTYWFSSLGNGSSASRRTLADAIIAAPGVDNRSSIMRDIMLNWGSDNPEELRAWLGKISDPDLKIDLLENASRVTYTEHPEQSLPLALEMPEGANRSERLANLLGSWSKIDADAALDWMKKHAGEPGVHEASFAVHGNLLGELAKDDPRAAITELNTLADPRARAAATTAIVNAWGAKDPAAALRWLADQKDASGIRYSIGGDNGPLSRWAKTDPEAALRWIETEVASSPDGKGMTSYYLEALAGRWNDKAPRATTADLYAKITDPALRVETLARHVKEWLTKDPDAARAWVEANPAFTPADRAKILPAK